MAAALAAGGAGGVPWAPYGTLSIAEAIAAVRLMRLRPVPAAQLTATVMAACTAAEWQFLLNLAAAGPGCVAPATPAELLEPLGPAALFCFADVFPRNVTQAVMSACDGSPRMLRESSSFAVEDGGALSRRISATGPAPGTAMVGGAGDDAFSSGGDCSDDDKEDEHPAMPLPAMAARASPVPGDKRPRGESDSHLPPPVVLPPCKYGLGCLRKNPQHFKEYRHPTSPTTTTAVGGALPPTPATAAAAVSSPAKPPCPDLNAFAIHGVVPLKAMPAHEFIFVADGGGHKMKNCGSGTYTCNCPRWRYQNRGVDVRTCKHLREYLGDAFEDARCREPGSAAGDGGGVVGHVPGGTVAAGGGKTYAIPGVLLANKALPKLDYTGWWLSEKLDGVRAYWDGTRLLSRNGNAFTAPAWFLAALPNGCTLDGELFGGRKKFQTTVGIVKSSPGHPGWATLTYELFDMPSAGALPFEDRMLKLQTLFRAPATGVVPAGSTHVHIVEQQLCTGAAHVTDALAAIEALGGEGLMLRQPKSTYVCARSNTLLKVKSTEEVDALVRGHDPGKGKHLGHCGALLVELANGKQFCVGSGLTDAQRAKPPAVGTVVVVRFQELTDGGIPRFPVFAGCRYDMDWPPKK